MNTNQNRIPIADMLKAFKDLDPGYFCVPSHHMGRGASEVFASLMGSNILKYDVTETPLTDDLHEAEGAIMEAQELAADLFGADRTFFLVNGTTCGNEAMIISSVSEGEKILVARNCHKSVLMGLIISGAVPVYIEPENSPEFFTFGSISPEKVEKAFEANPDIKAFIMTNPTYYGICSDMKSIADICHAHEAMLLVDEAHGAHLGFSDILPKSAIGLGADMSAQSTHKTLGSMTQTSMLHVKSSIADVTKVDSALRIVQSTSPSYILMASLDCARHDMAVNGDKIISNLIACSQYLREGLNSISGVHSPCGPSEGVFDTDPTRVVFSLDGMGGFELADMLLEKYRIATEMADSRNVIAVIGGGDSTADMDRLINAVREISTGCAKKHNSESFIFPPVPPMAMTPRQAYFAKTGAVPLENAVGMISAEMIAPYPPGIPVIYPGEIITQDIHSFLVEAVEKGRHIHSFSDKTMKTIKTVMEK
ncbi:MAG: aminotransferase class V-fold PLP-dependent enzyme [Clostridia bacterium]|nr:aminotransferase class V-fold PLP-dependent enzyme [Clostridia bacterium]